MLSNEADLDRVDEVRAECDAILVGAATVRNDNPRLLVRDARLRAAPAARGLGETPTKVTVTEHARLDACSNFFATGDSEKLVYCASRAVPVARRGWPRWRPSSTAVEPVEVPPPDRGPLRPRRTTAHGRGRGPGPHPVPDRRPRRRAAPGRRAVLRGRPRGRAGSSATAPSRGTPGTGRTSPRPARSGTWCSCATRLSSRFDRTA